MKNYYKELIVSVTIILAAFIFKSAYTAKNFKDDTISVTGLGETSFVSDLIVWRGGFSRKDVDLKKAYADLNNDRVFIKKYLLSKGIKEKQLVFSSVVITKEFDYVTDNSGNNIPNFTGYKLEQTIEVESKEVDKVEGISRQVSELINSGVEFYSESPEYYYTKLSELKLKMISQATKDAKNRAMKIAENAGSSLGRLKNADMGVFQIVAQNSSEDYSWGGSFNTSSKNKKANITIKMNFMLN